MMSTWITRAPASRTAWTWPASRLKSAARIEGATWRARKTSARACPVDSLTGSDGAQHRAVAMVTRDDRRTRHPHDGRVLPAVGADRNQLEAVQAIDAAVVAGHGGRPQPRFVAVGTLGAELDLLAVHPAVELNGRVYAGASSHSNYVLGPPDPFRSSSRSRVS